jgi:hypothetical protein
MSKDEIVLYITNGESISLQDLRDDYLYMQQALQPPTADKVCKELSEFVREDFCDNADIVECSYDKKYKAFIDSKPHCDLIAELHNGKVRTKYALPPRLIKLIGEFYIGVMNDET